MLSATGSNQTFTVPKGVDFVGAKLKGAGGGDSTFDGRAGGSGGSAEGSITVTAGDVLNVTVGTPTFGGGGLPGAGNRGTAGTGGGLSALWTGAPFTGRPLLLAGGGGGASGAGAPNPSGGDGGGSDGTGGNSTSGPAFAGGGGSQIAGGAGGQGGGTPGGKFQGGNGSDGTDSGGGGGRGWFGGGGGHDQINEGDANNDGGGGGGSGYVGLIGIVAGATTAGAGAGPRLDGQVFLQWTAPAPAIAAPADGARTSDTMPTFSGTGVFGTDLTLTIDGAAVVCTEADPVVIGNDATWLCTPTVALTFDSHAAVPSQRDPANPTAPYPSGPIVNFTVQAQPTPPGPPVITVPADGTRLGNNMPTLTGTGQSGATVDVIDVIDANGASLCEPHPVVGTDGSWTCTVALPLPDGPVTFTPTQMDFFNQVSDPGATVHAVIDTTAPGAPTITALPAFTRGHTSPCAAPGNRAPP